MPKWECRAWGFDVVTSSTVPAYHTIAIPGVTICLGGPGGLLKLRPKTLTGVWGVFVLYAAPRHKTLPNTGARAAVSSVDEKALAVWIARARPVGSEARPGYVPRKAASGNELLIYRFA